MCSLLSWAQRSKTVVPGDEAFKLYDTFGLPLDIAKDVAREHGFTVDEDGFQAALTAQRQRARSSAKFGLDVSAMSTATWASPPAASWATMRWRPTPTIIALIKGGEPADMATEGEEVELVLDATPFYAEKGGQVGDMGASSPATPAACRCATRRRPSAT